MSSQAVPGVVIDHIPACTARYVGSPSIAVLPDQTYVASHDVFGPESGSDLTRVFRSHGRGAGWKPVCEIQGQFWSNLFVHGGALYLMGTSGRYGSVTIRKSTDGGSSWSTPRDAATGLLLADGAYHTAPVPVVVHAGRVWRAMEDVHPGRIWGKHFRAFVMSAAQDADLLRADSWRCTRRVSRGEKWLRGEFGGWLEGNAVVSPAGEVIDILRVDYRHAEEKAAVVRVSADGREATFDDGEGFIGFPGGCKKFTIRRDDAEGDYWTLSNYVPERYHGYNPERARNTLALMRSSDLRHWELRAIVLSHPDVDRHAFQYVDWQFDGPDLIAVSRTAFDDGMGGAHNQHDANFMTFHRVEGYRSLE